MKKGCFCSRNARNGKKTLFFDRKMAFFSKNVIFDQKKGACGKPPAEKNGLFPRERHFWAKKKRLRQAATQKRCKMPTFFAEKTAKNTKIVIFCQKKAPAASRQPRKMVLFLEKRYLGKKKNACGKPPAKKGPKCSLFLQKNRKKTPKSLRNGHLSNILR